MSDTLDAALDHLDACVQVQAEALRALADASLTWGTGRRAVALALMENSPLLREVVLVHYENEIERLLAAQAVQAADRQVGEAHQAILKACAEQASGRHP